MGFYNVVRPCVVGKLHYATVPAQPIEVDDEVAAPLVEDGSLEPYQPGVRAIRRDIACATEAINALTLTPPDALPEDDEPPTNPPPPRARGPRRPKD